MNKTIPVMMWADSHLKMAKEIKIARVRKEERKNNEEETTTRLTTNNKTGLSSKTTNTANSKPRVKEMPKDILYGTSRNERQKKLKDKEYKNKLSIKNENIFIVL